MGFGREARRSRDSSLTLAHRLGALTSCIEFAQPIGFNATWSYLEATTGVTRSDPDFVLPAIELLERERAEHLALEHRYATHRRLQKANGLRLPPRCDATPRSPRRWHGDERAGALLALKFGRLASLDLAGHAMGRVAQSAATQALSETKADDVGALQEALTWARRQLQVIGWKPDPEEYRVAMDVHRLLGQACLLTQKVPRVGEPWHFVEPAN